MERWIFTREFKVEAVKLVRERNRLRRRHAIWTCTKPGQVAWYRFAGQFCSAKTVLDARCGLSALELLKSVAAEVHGQDLDNRLQREDVTIGGLDKIAPKSFDVVVSIDVVAHVDEIRSFIKHLGRIAREKVFMTTPNWSETGRSHITCGSTRPRNSRYDYLSHEKPLRLHGDELAEELNAHRPDQARSAEFSCPKRLVCAAIAQPLSRSHDQCAALRKFSATAGKAHTRQRPFAFGHLPTIDILGCAARQRG